MHNAFIIVLNIFICILNVIAFSRATEPLTLYTFRYYTYCSNLLAMINSILLCIFMYRYIKANVSMSKILYMINFVTTVSLALTMIVVITVLIPLQGAGGVEKYITGDIRSMAFHIITPILSAIVFVIIRKYNSLNIIDIFIPLIPTIVYAIILLILNATRIVDGPYAFLKVHNQPLYMTIFWTVCLLGGNLLFSWVFYMISKIK